MAAQLQEGLRVAISKAARLIKQAEVLFILAGAGMGVDSGKNSWPVI